MIRRGWTAILLALILPFVPALARAAPAMDCKAGVEARLAQEARDRSALAAIIADGKAHGLNGLVAYVDDLQGMLDHAPPRELPVCEDGMRYVRAMPAASAAPGGAAAPAPVPEGGKATVLPPSPYAGVALLLGSVYVQLQQWPEADRTLARGLAFAPANPVLVVEDALALNHLGRPQQGLDLCDRFLAVVGPPPVSRARVLRTRGFLLGELKRYDEGIAAYQLSLVAQPGDALAQRGIAYLTQRRATTAAGETPAVPPQAPQAPKAPQAGRPAP